jgi:hypothetical protein
VMGSTGKLKVTVYPNPTKGDLAVSLEGLDAQSTIEASLYEPGGRLLLREKTTVGVFRINLSGYADSWYLLKVVGGGETLHFKIIKE